MRSPGPYSIEYFIKKFEAIPDGEWTTGVFRDSSGRCCAQGFCDFVGVEHPTDHSERESLRRIFWDYNMSVVSVNDHADIRRSPGYDCLPPFPENSTPKQRILIALRYFLTAEPVCQNIP